MNRQRQLTEFGPRTSVKVIGTTPTAAGVKDLSSPLPSVTLPLTLVLAGNALINCYLFYAESLLRPQKAACTRGELAVHQEPQREQDKP